MAPFHLIAEFMSGNPKASGAVFTFRHESDSPGPRTRIPAIYYKLRAISIKISFIPKPIRSRHIAATKDA